MRLGLFHRPILRSNMNPAVRILSAPLTDEHLMPTKDKGVACIVQVDFSKHKLMGLLHSSLYC